MQKTVSPHRKSPHSTPSPLFTLVVEWYLMPKTYPLTILWTFFLKNAMMAVLGVNYESCL